MTQDAGSSHSTAWHVAKASLGHSGPRHLCPPPGCTPPLAPRWRVRMWALHALPWDMGMGVAIHPSSFVLAGGEGVQVKFQCYPL